MSKKIFILTWISILRIIATFFIYLFHFLGISNYKTNFYNLDYIAITLFCFISGVITYKISYLRQNWLIRRLAGIMIPYWIVIFFIIFINETIGYKESTFIQNVIVISGFGMFLHDRIYVLSWFITMINLFFLDIYIYSKLTNRYLKILFFLVSFLAFGWLTNIRKTYLLTFYFGYFFQKYNYLGLNMNTLNNILGDKINNYLFSIQSHCYSFFLIHGGILLFLIKVVRFYPFEAFLSGLLLTSILSIPHKYLADILIEKFNRHILNINKS